MATDVNWLAATRVHLDCRGSELSIIGAFCIINKKVLFKFNLKEEEERKRQTDRQAERETETEKEREQETTRTEPLCSTESKGH